MRHSFALPLFLAATAVVLAAMQGCATLSEADCVSADWSVMGKSDGQEGRPISELNRYRSQCSEYGVEPDSEAYLQGRDTRAHRFLHAQQRLPGRPVRRAGRSGVSGCA